MSIPAISHAPNPVTPAWLTRLSTAVNALIGKTNCVAGLTLAAGETSTVMLDARLSAETALSFTPLTASAAVAGASIYVTDRKKGSATINHASDAATDQSFAVSIHG
jgi:hypothetical protein